MNKKESFSIISLGCFRNTYDSEIVAKKFIDQGYVFKNNCKICDFLIINTCGFIDKAKEESLEVIKEAIDLKRKRKVKKILVLGCLVQRYRRELEKFFPQVDEWQAVVKFNQGFSKRRKLLPSHIDFLKICEGCINRCSFCAIPLIKGGLCSKPLNEVIKEAQHLERKGVGELNIIGQDITSWGKDLSGGENLTILLEQILKNTKSIKWIRLIYTHPLHLSDALIDLIAREKRICKYIDLPIQHISDRILKIMNRGISKEKIIDLIGKIRKRIANCVLRTSVIVGFPTESEEEFKELLDFIKDIRFQRLGAFIYSREENTPAYSFTPQVHPGTKKRRYNEIMSLQQKICRQLNSKFIGQEMEVIVERKENDIFAGRTQYDAYEIDGDVFLKRKGLKIGDFYKTKIIDAYDYDLVGA